MQVRPGHGRKFQVQAGDISYVRGACCVNRVDGKSNESGNGRFGMSSKKESMHSGVVGM